MKLFKHRPTEGYQTKISIINRRKAILTTAKYTFFGLIGLRLLWLQVFQKNKYSILSDRNRFKEWKIAAERGLILDRFNNKIAENRQLYRIALIKGDVTDLDFVLLTLYIRSPVLRFFVLAFNSGDYLAHLCHDGKHL